MKRCIILGSPGSGKSTFAIKLQKLTGLPLFHLDNIWWHPDKTHISRAEFDIALASVLEREMWIIDGDYSRTYETRIKKCDTVFFLDYDTNLCVESIKNRIGMKRSDIPWVDETFDADLLEKVLQYKENKRTVIFELLGKYDHKNVIIFRSRAEADEWLEKLKSGQ